VYCLINQYGTFTSTVRLWGLQMFKNISKYSYFSFIPLVFLGMLTIALFLLNVISVYYLLFTLVGWVLIAGLGAEAGYHRVFSHKQFKLPTWKENVILFFAVFAGQGSAITWTAAHRQHHRYADTDNDLHSPVVRTKWFAFFVWTKEISSTNIVVNMKYAVDLLKKPNHVWFHKNQLLLLWSVPILISLVDWKLTLSLICLPGAVSCVISNSINVFGHSKFMCNYRTFEILDNTQNNLFLALTSWGLGYHNNHHNDPTSFDFGTTISGKWWEYDPCRIFKPFLK